MLPYRTLSNTKANVLISTSNVFVFSHSVHPQFENTNTQFENVLIFFVNVVRIKNGNSLRNLNFQMQI